jgi:hypothetical protein
MSESNHELADPQYTQFGHAIWVYLFAAVGLLIVGAFTLNPGRLVSGFFCYFHRIFQYIIQYLYYPVFEQSKSRVSRGALKSQDRSEGYQRCSP